VKRQPFRLPDMRLETRFYEAKPPLAPAEALLEANRCLYCYDAPCVKACPTGIDIPTFIRKIATGNLTGAARTIFQANLLGLSTSRVCPVEELCVGACVYQRYGEQPIAIGRLQRFATETYLNGDASQPRALFTPRESTGKRVALIGAGPASLTCAATLVIHGVEAVIYEQEPFPGGLNTTGIAPYKLQAPDALQEAEWLLQLGIDLQLGVRVGSDLPAERLLQEFDAVFLGAGLGRDRTLGIPGEDLDGVWGGTEFIRQLKMSADFTIPEGLKKAAVIGGGNTAIDVARELAMLGVEEVDILYRRTEAEMPGYRHELDGARRYGVRLREHVRLTEIQRAEGNSGLILQAQDTVTGAALQFSCDWLVVAIGQEKIAGELIPDIEVDEKGQVKVDVVTRRTTNPKVYAGGDCINGGKEVVNAVADGREAALAMLKAFQIEP